MKCTYCNTRLPDQSRFCLVCGADLSDPEVSTRQRAAVKELFAALKVAVEGRYRVTDMLGRGGMGAVFLAEDLRLERLVAIKVLRPELAEESAFVGRFQREARIAASLDHPNIIPVYGVEQVGDFHYFVMKYIRGKSADELLQGKPLPLELAQRILLEAAQGLAHAHRRKVIHRDIKPSNIMVDDDGHVVITDFGISKALLSDTQYTSTGQMVGTPRYLSPEQAQGLSVDGRSDQYSLGVVGYQMLVGRLPLIAETVHALLYKHIYEVPTPARELRPDIPEGVSAAIQRSLSKKPDDRFPTLEEFVQAMSGVQPVQWSTPPHATTQPLARVTPPRRWIGRAAIGVGTLLTAAMIFLSRSSLRPDPGVTGAAIPGSVPPATPSTPVPDAGVPDPRDTLPSVSAPVVAERNRDTLAAVPPPRAQRKLPAPKRAAPAGSPSGAARTQPPVPAPSVALPSTGYITINAVPYGSVSIDGVDVGDTPLVRQELTPGPHVVKIVRAGFRTDSSIVVITAGNEVRFSRTLLRETR
jgi:serine/threonine protein kinase